MVSRPAVARSATGQPSCLAITSVSGPGQNAAASFRPASVRRPSRAAASVSGTFTIRGLKCGRPLVAKIAATARPLVASAPSPYTVSVGNATRAPSRSAAPAAATASRVASRIAIEPCTNVARGSGGGSFADSPRCAPHLPYCAWPAPNKGSCPDLPSQTAPARCVKLTTALGQDPLGIQGLGRAGLDEHPGNMVVCGSIIGFRGRAALVRGCLGVLHAKNFPAQLVTRTGPRAS